MIVEKYLKRINYTGDLHPSLANLRALQEAHLYHIPFENLDIPHTPIILDTQRIFQKVINQQRGGFCYELNGLFFELLKALGYSVKRISARVFGQRSQQFGHPFDHLAIIVHLDQQDFLVDVGFGDFCFCPLQIQRELIQADHLHEFKIVDYDDQHQLVLRMENGEWKNQYIFDETARDFSEFEQMCQWHQSSPDSHFTVNRLCSLATTNGRITLSGQKLKIREGETLREVVLDDQMSIDDILQQYFYKSVEL